MTLLSSLWKPWVYQWSIEHKWLTSLLVRRNMQNIPKRPIPPNSTLSAFWPKKPSLESNPDHRNSSNTHTLPRTQTLTNAVQKSTQDRDKVHSRKTRCRSMMKNSRQVRQISDSPCWGTTLLLNVNRYNLINNYVTVTLNRTKCIWLFLHHIFSIISWLSLSTTFTCRHYLHWTVLFLLRTKFVPFDISWHRGYTTESVLNLYLHSNEYLHRTRTVRIRTQLNITFSTINTA